MHNRPTTVVHLSSVHTWNDTRIYQRICRSLAAKGYDVHWIVPCQKELVDQPRHGEVEVTIHPLPLPRGRLSRATVTAFHALREARRIDGDRYHFHDPELIWVGLALRALGHKVVYDVHEDIVGDVREKPWIPKFIRPVVGWMTASVEAIAAKALSGVVTAGDDIRQRLGRHTTKCIAVRNYPSLKSFPRRERAAPSSPPRLIFLGGINTTNVPQNIVRALSLLPDELDCRLVWGGKRAVPEVLRELQEHDGWQRVDYVGFVPFHEVNELMNDAVGAIVLYANAPNNFSIRSNRLFETMAVSLPIIGPSFGSWPEFFRQHPCGIAVDPDRPAEIAAAMAQLVNDPERSLEMGRVGRASVEAEFHWEAELDRLCAFYERL